MKEPKFARRHYKMIAAVLSECATPPWRGRDPMWNEIKHQMGSMLADDNPRFNRGKFEEACEP